MNLKHKIIALALFSGLSFSAFSQNAVKTASGYTFINHTNLPGAKAQAGEKAFINLYVYIKDSLLSSTVRDFGGPRDLVIPAKEQLDPSQPVPPIFEALNMMAKGDSATVLQPLDSAMAATIPPVFGKVTEIRFVIVIADLIDKATMEKLAEEAKAKGAAAIARFPEVETATQALVKEFSAGKLNDKLKTTASGLQMIVHDMGKGAAIKKGENIAVHYYGCLTDGKLFDNSFQRGEPISFGQGIGQMIPGFDEGAGMLNHGGKATLFIPSQLGYGDDGTPDGSIPGKSTLVFYIEVE